MTRQVAQLAIVVIVLVGCRPSAPPVAEAVPHPPAQPSDPRSSDDDAVFEPAELVAEELVAEELVAVEPTAEASSEAPGVLPPGVDAPESACEQSCGEVHACVLVERSYTPSAAAAIELGCVGACLRTAERATLFGCGRPAAIELGACSPFLACVAAAWPEDIDGETTVQPVVEPNSGCARGCEAYARCWDPATTPERVAQCTELCQQALDDEHERLFGTCAEFPDCDDITACVAETPGA
jgi:hypothetical protein